MIRIGQLALTALVTWFVVSRVGLGLDDLAGLEAEAWTPRPGMLIVASAALLLAYLASASIWGRIVRDFGGPTLPARDSIQVFMVANLGRYVPGKVWQIAGLATLAHRRGVPMAAATGAAVAGQGVALVAAAVIGVPALFWGPDPFPAWGWVAVVVLATAVATGSIPAVFHRVMGAWFRLTRSAPPVKLAPSRALGWFGLYLLNWMLYAAAFRLFALSFDPGGAAVAVASSFAAAYVLGYVMIFAPAGLGPREGFLILFLTPHLGTAPSTLVAVAARVWTTLVEVVPAGVAWILELKHRPAPSGTPLPPPESPRAAGASEEANHG